VFYYFEKTRGKVFSVERVLVACEEHWTFLVYI